MLLRQWPDPVLSRSARLVDDPTQLMHLAEAMVECMILNHGVGLAANQVGRIEHLFVAYDLDVTFPGAHLPSPSTEPAVMGLVNGHVERVSGLQVESEGCLSVQHQRVEVRRPDRVVVCGLDLFGSPVRWKVEGYQARIVCHELDHLAGRVILSPGLTA